jgi:hypothetical protein
VASNTGAAKMVIDISGLTVKPVSYHLECC